MSNKRFSGFDALKGIACIAVVFIHYNFIKDFQPVGDAIRAACRFAVPIFFMISGFFLSPKGLLPTGDSLVKKIRHILKITIYGVLFYIVFMIWWNNVMFGKFILPEFMAKFMGEDNILRFFLTNRPFVYGHFWFLWALICCYLVVGLVSSEKVWSICVNMWPVLLLGTCCTQEFANVLKINPTFMLPSGRVRIDAAHLFVFRALPFFLLGVWLRRNSQSIAKFRIKDRWFFLIAVLGCLLSVGEWLYTKRNAQFFVGSYITAIALMCGAIGNPQTFMSNGGRLSIIGRDLSTLIFITHIAVGKTYDWIGKICHFYGNQLYYLTRSLVILLATFAVSLLIFFILKRVLPWLNRWLIELMSILERRVLKFKHCRRSE